MADVDGQPMRIRKGEWWNVSAETLKYFRSIDPMGEARFRTPGKYFTSEILKTDAFCMVSEEIIQTLISCNCALRGHTF
jgi:hypothetical protein